MCTIFQLGAFVLAGCTIACGSMPGVSTEQEVTARQILARTCEAYGTTSTYSDDGELQVFEGTGELAHEGRFSTKFQRPDQMTFSINARDVQSRFEQQVSLVLSGAEVQTAVDRHPFETAPNLAAALQSIAGVSWHVSQIVPRLLSRDADFMCGATTEVAVVGVQVVGGVECKALRIRTASQHEFRLFVSPQASIVGWHERLGQNGERGELRVSYRVAELGR